MSPQHIVSNTEEIHAESAFTYFMENQLNGMPSVNPNMKSLKYINKLCWYLTGIVTVKQKFYNHCVHLWVFFSLYFYKDCLFQNYTSLRL